MAVLSGLKVLDLSRVLAIPYATQVFADFGSTVWKVEALGGDDARGWGDNYFTAFNRGKKSIALDLKRPEGREIVKRLAQQADVVVENFKVGDLRRYGLDYETLSAERPELIYLSLTGFGQTGPRRGQLGYDTVMQGMTGIMSLTGDAAGPPTKVGVAWIDVLSGLTAAVGLLMALREKDRSGQGQYVDLSLFEVGLAALVDAGQGYLNSGVAPTRHGSVHRSFAPSQPFECADGWIMVAVGKEAQFTRLCQAIGRAELAGDQRFVDNERRLANRDALTDELAALFRRHDRQHWMELCEAARVPVSPLNTVDEALADPQSLARNVVWQLGAGDGASPRVLASPLQHMSRTPPRPQGPVPGLGEHTAEIMADVLGIDQPTIRALHEAGIVAAPPPAAAGV